jgi:hypothetical protein
LDLELAAGEEACEAGVDPEGLGSGDEVVESGGGDEAGDELELKRTVIIAAAITATAPITAAVMWMRFSLT